MESSLLLQIKRELSNLEAIFNSRKKNNVEISRVENEKSFRK